MTATGLGRRRSKHYHLGADRHTLIQVNHIGAEQTESAAAVAMFGHARMPKSWIRW